MSFSSAEEPRVAAAPRVRSRFLFPNFRPPTRNSTRRKWLALGKGFASSAPLVNILPVLSTASAAVIFSLAAIYRHDRFASNGFDLGIFDQTVWGYSHLHILPNTVKRIPNLLGDHFHPALMFLAPGYWIWNDARVLLVEQALLISLSSIPVYLWARERLGCCNALCLQVAYFAFWGVVSGVLFDFHEAALSVFAISWGTWAMLKSKDKLFAAMFVLGCASKEDVALTFMMMGVYMLAFQRRVRMGTSATALALVWFAVSVRFLIPALAGRPYAYGSSALANGPTTTVLALLERPWRAFSLLVDRPQKRVFLRDLAASWSFLPLLSPLVILMAPTIAERLWSPSSGRWTTQFHYSLPIAPIAALASIDAIALVANACRAKIAAALSGFVLVAGVLISFFVVHSGQSLKTLMSPAKAKETLACLSHIPDGAPVAASNAFVPHLTHRREIYPLFAAPTEQYLAIYANVGSVAQIIRRRSAYRLVCRGGAAVVLTRISPSVLR